jgi:hypothetical protein
MLLITEFKDSGLEYITEGTGTGEKKVFIEGVFMQAEQENRNKRIYPRAILAEAVNKYVAEQVMTGRAVGELNHPEGPTINLDKVSHRITSLRWDGNDVVGKALILNTPMGLIVKGLVEGGVKLGVSSRGMGSVENRGGVTYVKDDFMLATVDIVQDPSAPSAFVEGIMESVDWTFDGSHFIANKVDKMAERLKSAKGKMNSKEYGMAQTKEFSRLLEEISKKI